MRNHGDLLMDKGPPSRGGHVGKRETASCEATNAASPSFDRGMADGWGYGVLSIDGEKLAPDRCRLGSEDPKSRVTWVL